ncbi:MAG TPA: dolichyl-phosphate beta-glucosyltransferase [Nitrospiraceae bacterium]|nr:dolichyl-phosphate beta-glucosyltransferase [Nitrospiraceae bacterium]
MPFHLPHPNLSVVIPAYNEAERILPYLTNITSYLNRRGQPYEVLVVDDGSHDDTAVRVSAFRLDEPAVRVMRLPRNTGKGAAVRMGMLEARGDLRLIADADGATPIEELERLESRVRHGADLAVGSRSLASQDRRYSVNARWHRSVLGNCFNGIVRRLGVNGISDTQCGFKLLRGTVARDLFSVGRVNGYGFDLEILYVAQRRGYRIAEVPVNWNEQAGSKVRIVRDGMQMIRDLLAVRHHYQQGYYVQMDMGHLIRSHRPQAFT